MKKKLLSMILATSMMLSVCACGNSAPEKESSEKIESSQSSTSQQEASTAAEEKEALYPIVDEPITIKGFIPGIELQEGENRIVWEKAAEITNVNIEWITADDLATYLAGGDWPDFFHCKLSTNLVNDYGVIGGRFVNYLDYLDIMPNLAQTFEDYPWTLAASTQMNGEMYNLFKVEGAPSSTGVTARPHVRKDVLEDAGITELPTTVDEFYEQLVILKEKNGTPSFVLDNSSTTYWPTMLFAAFGTLTQMDFADDGNGNVVFSRTSDQMKYYYTFLNKLYEEELMNREWLTMDSTVRKELAKSGKVAYISGSVGTNIAAEDLKNGDWSYLDCVAPLTSEYDSTQTLCEYVDYVPDGGMYINAESEYVEEMCKLFDMMFSVEEIVEGSGLSGHTWTYGIEGVDWKLSDDGSTYEQLVREGYNTYSDAQSKAIRFLNLGRGGKFGLAVTSTPGNAQARQISFVNNVIPYQTVTAFPLSCLKFTEDEQSILDNKLLEVQTYYQEMEAKFITGAADIETEWDEYVANCEKMGINDVLNVYQAAYDRYNEAMTVK